jgi:hypothetical protein
MAGESSITRLIQGKIYRTYQGMKYVCVSCAPETRVPGHWKVTTDHQELGVEVSS